MLPEFDHETATTRTLLERVPDSKAGWKPHAKSMSLGELAMHVASIPDWTPITLKHTEFDSNPDPADTGTPVGDGVVEGSGLAVAVATAVGDGLGEFEGDGVEEQALRIRPSDPAPASTGRQS